MIDDDVPEPVRASPAPGRATVVGTGLIGGSIGLALRRAGWHVSGVDGDEARSARALELGAIDAVGHDEASDITFVATPVAVVADAVRVALERTSGLVTDVGSVKGSIVAAIDDARFVGGHPMAGSEQEGVDGSSADLFAGAVWVLTPTASTDDAALTRVHSIVSSLGAEVLALPPERHDEFVAVVSHVPHLTAASLMNIAGDRADEHAALLRLAAGGFRDMTRIASGHPGIWPDICDANKTAIVHGLDRLIDRLQEARSAVAGHDEAGLLELLTAARRARINLPSRYTDPSALSVFRIPVPDRRGVLADITTLAAELDVNIVDLELAHSSEGGVGVAMVITENDAVDRFRGGLVGRGYRHSIRRLQ